MAHINLTENPVQQMQVAQGVGSSIANIFNRIKQQRAEQKLIGYLSDPNLTANPKELLNAITGIPNIIETEIGQEAMQAQMGIGRYYQSPFEQELMKSRIESTESLNRQRQINSLYNEYRLNQLQYDNAESGSEEEAKAQKNITRIMNQISALTSEPAQVPTTPTQIPTQNQMPPTIMAPEAERWLQGVVPKSDLQSLKEEFNKAIQTMDMAKAQQIQAQINRLLPQTPQSTTAIPQPPQITSAPGRTVQQPLDVKNELYSYINNLDPVSKQQLQQIIEEGDERIMKIALERLKQRGM